MSFQVHISDHATSLFVKKVYDTGVAKVNNLIRLNEEKKACVPLFPDW